MPQQAKKRLLAAQARFRRDYIVWFNTSRIDSDGGVTHISARIEKRIPHHKRVWK